MDVKTANDLYGCAAHCPSSTHCNNMGFMGADCSCMCPWGLTGDACDEVISSTAGPPGSSIKLWFNKFEMEDDDDAPCGYDWVEVRTLGPHLVGPKMCGSGPSSHIEHHGNALYVRFQSDDSYNDFSGFEAGYSIEGGDYYSADVYYDNYNDYDSYKTYNSYNDYDNENDDNTWY
ncbi:blastula protease 10-like [Haliotis rubra]|uniref:blastula protease 10-like n=1 Tax=Haliotis rubra TaxID=36100 RepID=UPI001EE51F95|nr:blastula protease 10-like [Haliotis rubra]XP_046571839.1 blastula protease 10-like [Haliotis rubra]